jgi:hypothetical protein
VRPLGPGAQHACRSGLVVGHDGLDQLEQRTVVAGHAVGPTEAVEIEVLETAPVVRVAGP